MLSKIKSKKIALLKYGLSARLFSIMLIVSMVDIVPSQASAQQVTQAVSQKEYMLDQVIVGQDFIPTTTEASQATGFAIVGSPPRMPQFPDGITGWAKFMKGYNPALAKANKASGTVYVSFVIEKDGSLTDIKVERDIGSGSGEEAIRLLKTSPKWIPGVENGRMVPITLTQPIKIPANL